MHCGLCEEQYFEYIRKTVKWWKKLFFHLFQLLITNAYILFKKYGAEDAKKRTHQQFCAQLVRLLLETAKDAPRPKRRGQRAEPLDRLTGRHFPAYILPKPGAKRVHPLHDCVACNLPKKKRTGFVRKQTTFCCNQCEVSLCVPVCFEVYHTKKFFERELRHSDTVSDSE